MKLTYICSPCRGDYEKNIIKAQEYCREAMNDGLLPIAPHVYFTQFVDDTDQEDRKRGMRCGLQLLRYCQLIRIYGCKVSSGMYGEIQLAGVLEIDIEVYGPPEFIERVMEIYHNAAISQWDLSIKRAATYADQPAAMPATKQWQEPLLPPLGPNIENVTAVHIDINKTQAAGLAEQIAEVMRKYTGLLRGGA